MELLNFLVIKKIHISCAVLTFLSFSLRGYWMITGSPRLRARAARTVPHVIDAVLLTTGITMAVMMYGEFYRQGWLQFKLTALLCYIVLGAVALRYGRTRRLRIASLVGAWGAFLCIITIAMNHVALTLWMSEP